MQIRSLSVADAVAFRALRLAALAHSPEAFVSSHAEECDLPLSHHEARLAQRPGQAVFGGFDGDALVGVVGLTREARQRLAHKANVWGMYVSASARGQGIARALMEAAIVHARALPGLAKVTLSVDSANVPAIALYESLGFEVFAREADAVRLDGQSRDDLQMHLRFDVDRARGVVSAADLAGLAR